MAAAAGQQSPALTQALLGEGGRFSFFQAVRLLQRCGDGLERTPHLRIRPKLSLGFPDTDIDRIRALPDGGHEIIANFFGLYGVASPLPTFYTEDLFEEEREGRHATRDFLDIVHQSLYGLLIDCWNKYRLPLRIIERFDAKVLNHLYAFVGLEDADLRQRLPQHRELLLRYAGLFNQQIRSAQGLCTLLADAFAPAQVDVLPCVARVAAIPEDQRLRLGVQAHRLGEESYLGCEIDDCASHCVVRLADLPEDVFHSLLPGSDGNSKLQFLISFYLIDPLNVDIELQPRRGSVEPARLGGGDWSRLGLDSWLVPAAESSLAPVRFEINHHRVSP